MLRISYIGDRAMRLFSCRCAERALLREREAGREPDPILFAAVEAARRYAVGEATAEEMADARWAALRLEDRLSAMTGRRGAQWTAAIAATSTTSHHSHTAAPTAAEHARDEAYWQGGWPGRAEERARQADDLRRLLTGATSSLTAEGIEREIYLAL